MYLGLRGVFTRILSVISDRTQFKLVFQKKKKKNILAHITHLNSGVGPGSSRGGNDIIRTQSLSPT